VRLGGGETFGCPAERLGNLVLCCPFSFDFGCLTKEEEATALNRFAPSAIEVGGGGDSAEEDEPVPEGSECSFFRFAGHPNTPCLCSLE